MPNGIIDRIPLLKLVRRGEHSSKDAQKTTPTGLVRGISSLSPEYADPSLSDLVEYYRRDEYVGYTVEAFATRTVGMGFFLTGEQPRALKLVDNLCRANRLHLLLHWKIARDVWLSGNAFINTVPSEKVTTLHYLPLSSFYNVLRDQGGNVESYVQQWGGNRKFLGSDEVWHYRWNPVDEDPFGEGLVNRLARPGKGYQTEQKKTRKRPPYLQMREKRIDNAHRILARYQPRHAYTGVPSAQLDSFVSQLNTLEPEQDFATDFELKIEEAKMDPRTRFESLLDLLDRMDVVGLHNPMLRLITLAGFTFASSQAAMETIEPEIRMMQRFIKEQDEALFAKVLEQHGGSPDLANVELHWGVPERPELLIADIINAYRTGLELGNPIITREEAREMLREVGWIVKEGPKPESVYAGKQTHEGHFIALKGKVYAISETFWRYLREIREPPPLMKAPKVMVKEDE
ncbi:MAG: hypothetical protein HXX80_02470 [Nitrososphaerales archaeon]|nr:hypothetical protein [Nitrososphaerales archaeon]